MQRYIILFIGLVLVQSQTDSFNHTIYLNHYSGCANCIDRPRYFGCSHIPESFNWGNFEFMNEAPIPAIVTEVKIVLYGTWNCANTPSIVEVSLQGNIIDTKTILGKCSCEYCEPPVEFRWIEFGRSYPNYNYDGSNLIHIEAIQGQACVNKIYVEIIYREDRGYGNVRECGTYGECNLGHMRCVDETSYQICVYDETGSTFWSPDHLCNDGFKCNSAGNHTFCEQSASQNQTLPTNCTDGQLRCVNSTSYQVCSDGVWSNVTSCGSGQSCNPDPLQFVVFCVDDTFLNETEICAPREMRCVTNDTYQTCAMIDTVGTGNWNPVQRCAANHRCVPDGNVIYCVEIKADADCEYRSMRCTSQSTYQTCARGIDSKTYWDTIQSCQPGLSCHVHEPYIYCY